MKKTFDWDWFFIGISVSLLAILILAIALVSGCASAPAAPPAPPQPPAPTFHRAPARAALSEAIVAPNPARYVDVVKQLQAGAWIIAAADDLDSAWSPQVLVKVQSGPFTIREYDIESHRFYRFSPTP